MRRLAAWRRARGCRAGAGMDGTPIPPSAAPRQGATAALADLDGSLSQIDGRPFDTMHGMAHRRRARVAALLIVLASAARAGAQDTASSPSRAGSAPYARIAILRPH